MEEGSGKLIPSAKILDVQDRFLKIEFLCTSEVIIRSLRRILISEVPTIGIDTVDIEKNSSSFENSIIADRLAVIPLTSDRATSLYYSADCPNCKGEGYCDLCSVEFRLSAKCDVTSSEALNVTRKDLTSSDPAVVPADFVTFHFLDTGPEGPAIVTLGPGEEVELKAVARKGIGKDKKKWPPTALVSYFTPAQARINEELMETLTLEQKERWVASFPSNMFQIDSHTKKVVLSHPEAYHYGDKVAWKAKAIGKPGLVQMCILKDTFIFTVETSGVLKASQLLMNAIEILKQNLLSVHLLEDDDDLFGELVSDMQKLDIVD